QSLHQVQCDSYFQFSLMSPEENNRFKYPGKRGIRPFVKYVTSPLAIIDLLAILPSILIIIAPYYAPLNSVMDLRVVRMLRTMRLLRIFKITRYSQSMRLIGAVLREKRRDLSVTIFITLMLMVVSATLMYHVEHEAQQDKFPNIFSTLWWAVATLTTVGYGDVYPITALGKILSGIIALLGIGLVALPTGILSSAFVDRMARQKAEEIDEAEAHFEHGLNMPMASAEDENAPVKPFVFCPYCGERLPHGHAPPPDEPPDDSSQEIPELPEET
ncbi:MAG: ion transporter, partial [Bacteroidota bacterium]